MSLMNYRYGILRENDDKYKRLLLLRDDVRKIEFKYLEDKPLNVTDEWVLWAEYDVDCPQAILRQLIPDKLSDERYRYRIIDISTESHREVIILQDDGYRIFYQWLEGRPSSMDEGWELWAEYKQCNNVGVGSLIADVIMGE